MAQNTPHQITGDTVEIGMILSVGAGSNHWRNVKVVNVVRFPAPNGFAKNAYVTYHDGTEDTIWAGQFRTYMTDDTVLGVVCPWMTVPAPASASATA